MPDETRIPSEIVDEFRTLSQNYCSWREVADFAAARMNLKSGPHRLTTTNPRKMPEEAVAATKDEEYVRHSTACYAISIAAGFLERIHHPFSSSNSDQVLEKAFKVGDLRLSILTKLTLMGGTDIDSDLDVFSDLINLKTELPKMTMKDFEDLLPRLFSEDAITPLRPDMRAKIQVIFDGPSSLN